MIALIIFVICIGALVVRSLNMQGSNSAYTDPDISGQPTTIPDQGYLDIGGVLDTYRDYRSYFHRSTGRHSYC